MAIVLMVFLTVVFGMVELSVAVFRYHIVSQAARQAARMAIVHGELAPPTMTDWNAAYGGGTNKFGPQTISTAAADNEIIYGKPGDTGFPGITKYIAGLDPAGTTIQLEWIDGDTRLGSRVRATVTTTYSPLITFLFSDDFTLTGQSVMQIAH